VPTGRNSRRESCALADVTVHPTVVLAGRDGWRMLTVCYVAG